MALSAGAKNGIYNGERKPSAAKKHEVWPGMRVSRYAVITHGTIHHEIPVNERTA